MPRKLIDVTGKRFGKLVVRRRLNVRHGLPEWKCDCDCGNTTVAHGHNLRSGRTSSCGCIAHAVRDLTGGRFGRWTVIGLFRMVRGRGAMWSVRCDCGSVGERRSDLLTLGSSRSCGCLNVDCHKTHGMKKSPEYRVWRQLKDRCRNPRCKGYAAYGGRGILVCEEWASSFESFLADVGLRPSAAHSIDRIDNNGNYEPGNCRWATKREQQRNRRNTVMAFFRGKSLPLSEWCDRCGLSRFLVDGRIRNGWSVDDALSTPVGGRRDAATS